MKQVYTITRGEAEVARNELSIEQLRRITEMEKLKVVFEA
jgi:hypothetical protein